MSPAVCVREDRETKLAAWLGLFEGPRRRVVNVALRPRALKADTFKILISKSRKRGSSQQRGERERVSK